MSSLKANETVKSRLLDAADINRALTRMAHEIVEKNRGVTDLAIIGIRTRGEFIARRLAAKIQEFEKASIPVGILDVSFYRDDTRAKLKQPIVQSTEIPFDVNEKLIVLADDVLFTGRSVRAAIDEIMDFGRPKKVQLAVLIDRGHRELSIQPDYVGKAVDISMDEAVHVRLTEHDEKDEVVLVSA